MPPIPVKPALPPQTKETLEERLRRLEAVWNAETAHLSSASKIIGHPAFREIVNMGEPVVPLLLRDLEKEPSFWVWVLWEITGADPVPPSDRGNIAKMTDAWLCWGRAKGYAW